MLNSQNLTSSCFCPKEDVSPYPNPTVAHLPQPAAIRIWLIWCPTWISATRNRILAQQPLSAVFLSVHIHTHSWRGWSLLLWQNLFAASEEDFTEHSWISWSPNTNPMMSLNTWNHGKLPNYCRCCVWASQPTQESKGRLKLTQCSKQVWVLSLCSRLLQKNGFSVLTLVPFRDCYKQMFLAPLVNKKGI